MKQKFLLVILLSACISHCVSQLFLYKGGDSFNGGGGGGGGGRSASCQGGVATNGGGAGGFFNEALGEFNGTAGNTTLEGGAGGGGSASPQTSIISGFGGAGGGGGGRPYQSQGNLTPSKNLLMMGGGAAQGAGGGGSGGPNFDNCAVGGGGGSADGSPGSGGLSMTNCPTGLAGQPGTNGRTGGGIIILWANSLLATSSSMFLSNGGQGGNGGHGYQIGSCPIGGAGGGGGGANGAAGGSIYTMIATMLVDNTSNTFFNGGAPGVGGIGGPRAGKGADGMTGALGRYYAEYTFSQVNSTGTNPTEFIQTTFNQNIFGTGKDGDLILTGGTFDLSSQSVIVGRYCPPIIIANVIQFTSSRSALVASPYVSNQMFSPINLCLVPGDEVLVMNLQAYNTNGNVGRYEVLTVASVVGTNISFTSPKINFYGDGNTDNNIGTGKYRNKVIIQRIPHFNDMRLTNATIRSQSFDGTKGGVLAFKVRRTLTMANSHLDMSMAGYPGGVSQSIGPHGSYGITEIGGGEGGGGSGGNHDSMYCAFGGLSGKTGRSKVGSCVYLNEICPYLMTLGTTSIVPNIIPITGMSNVILSGRGFTNSTMVRFGRTGFPNVFPTMFSPNAITVQVQQSPIDMHLRTLPVETSTINPQTFLSDGVNVTIVAYCYGISASDPNVCSGNGICVGPDFCQCTASFGGPQCNMSVCSGCNYNGDCIGSLYFNGRTMAYSASVNIPVRPNHSIQTWIYMETLKQGSPFSTNFTNVVITGAGGIIVTFPTTSITTISGIIFAKKWHFLTVTVNLGQAFLYVDGTLYGSAPFVPPVDVATALVFGSDVNSNLFTGYISEFQIWNHFITTFDAQLWMSNIINGPQNGLIVHYTFIEQSQGSLTILDKSGNGNHLFLQAAYYYPVTSPTLPRCRCKIYTGSECQTPVCFSFPGTFSSVCSGKGQCFDQDNCLCSRTPRHPNLIAYWPMEGTNATASDNGNIYVLPALARSSQNNIMQWTMGIIGRARRFSQVNSAFMLLQTAHHTVQGSWFPAFSLAAAFYLDTTGIYATNNFILDFAGPTDSTGLIITMASSNVPILRHYVRFGQNIRQFDVPLPPSILNSWHITVLTFNGSSISAYLDGAELSQIFTQASVAIPDRTVLTLFSSGTHSTIGRNATCISCNEYFTGIIDEVQMFNKALSTADITALQNQYLNRTYYYGSTCNEWSCFGIDRSNPNVCRGLGPCIDIDTCACTSGGNWPDCNVAMCDGIPATSPSVCSGRGTCINATCICQPNWSGLKCQITSCYAISSEAQNVCSGHGTCIGFNQCNCSDSDITGHWAGSDCSACKSPFIPPTCTQSTCNPVTTCSGHGECSVSATCICYKDTKNGYWTGSSCNVCESNWFGPNCNTYIASKAVFTSHGEGLSMNFSGISSVGSVMDCSRIFDTNSLVKLGKGATCMWSSKGNNMEMMVLFGYEPTIMPGGTLNVIIGSSGQTAVVTVDSGYRPLIPSAVIRSTSLVGSCDGVTLDGSFSISSERRPLKYRWTSNSAGLNSFLSTLDIYNPIAIIPANMLTPGSSYTFTLIVESAFNVNGTGLFTVNKHTAPTPSVVIKGPLIQTAYIGEPIKLEGQLLAAGCVPNNETIVYLWTQVVGPTISFQNNSRILFLPAFSFVRAESPIMYMFMLSASLQSDPRVTSRAFVTLVVSPRPLVAHIIGGNYLQSMEEAFFVDARLTHDPDRINMIPNPEIPSAFIPMPPNSESYIWGCAYLNSTGCAIRPESGQVQPTNLTVYGIPNFFYPEFHNITLAYVKRQRNSIVHFVMEVRPGPVLKTSVSPVLAAGQSWNPSERIVLQAAVQSQYVQVSLPLFSWSVKTRDGTVQLGSADLPFSTDQQSFAIRANSLMPFETYSFRVDTQVDVLINGQRRTIFGYASTPFARAQPPPFIGQVKVFPQQGLALETDFTIVCPQWGSSQPPITYSFAYISNTRTVNIAQGQTSNSITVKLPPGVAQNNGLLVVQVRVTDVTGAYFEASTTVHVSAPAVNSSSINQIWNSTKSLIDDALARGDYSIATQLITVASGIMNNNRSSIQPDVTCPNACSGHGTCLSDGTCQCFTGYATSDCSLTDEELKQRQQVRHDLVNTLVTTFNQSTQQQPVTTDIVSQQSGALSEITSQPEELSQQTRVLALSHLNVIMKASVNDTVANPDVKIDQSITKAMGAVISNVADASFARTVLSIEPNTTTGDAIIKEAKDITNRIVNSISQLSTVVLSTALLGEAPLTVIQPTISIGVQKQVANKLGNYTFTMTNAKNQPSYVRLPSVLNSEISLPIQAIKRALPPGAAIEIRSAQYAKNPYSWSASSRNLTSSVLSFGLQFGKQVVPVYNLSEPIVFQIRGRFTTNLTADGCITVPSYAARCQYWHAESETWRSDGCKSIAVDAESITCSCNHLTDFGSFLEYIIPQMNILTPADLIAVVYINKDDYTTLIVVCCIVGIYIILFLFLSSLEVIVAYNRRKDLEVTEDKLAKISTISKVWEIIKDGHAWVAIFFRPRFEKHFTRPQRVTVLFIAILLTLTTNALFFNTVQTNIARTIVAAIISNIITMPAPLILTILFKGLASKPVKSPLRTTPPNVTEHVREFELEDSQKRQTAPVTNPTTATTSTTTVTATSTVNLDSHPHSPVVHHDNDPHGHTHHDDHPDHHHTELLPNVVHHDSEHHDTPQQTGTLSTQKKKQPSKQTPSTTEEENFKDIEEVEDRIRQRHSYRQSIEISTTSGEKSFTKIWLMHKYNDCWVGIEDALDGLEIWTKRFTKRMRKCAGYILAGLGVVLIIYFILIAVLIILLELLFQPFWLRYYTTALVCVSIILVVVGMEYLYFMEKREKFRLDNVWHWSIKSMVIAAAIIVLCVLSFIMTLAVSTSVQFWSATDKTMHTAIVAVTLVILAVCAGAWIFFHLKKPKMQVETEIHQEHKGFLPWWCIFFIYPFAWAIMAVCSWVNIAYGIKFGKDKANAWLGSSFGGIGQDMFVSSPANIVVKGIIIAFLVHVIQVMFFDTLTPIVIESEHAHDDHHNHHPAQTKPTTDSAQAPATRV